MAEVGSLVLAGLYGSGQSRQAFAGRLAGLSIAQYTEIAEMCIWMATRDISLPGSDWHWMSAACFAEAIRRRCPGLYDRAVRRACGEL